MYGKLERGESYVNEKRIYISVKKILSIWQNKTTMIFHRYFQKSVEKKFL